VEPVVSDPKVIDIATRLTEVAPLEVARPEWDACRHEHVWLEESLRTCTCRDCGAERVDPFDVLVRLARKWSRWQREAEQLRTLNAQYVENRRDKWERARDRHLNANPAHRGAFRPTRRQDNGGGWTRGEQPCRTCDRIEQDYDPRWYPTPAPEPPPGRLDPA
jgi:hypothetical protein